MVPKTMTCDIIRQKSIVMDTTPSLEEFEREIVKRVGVGKNIKIMYGETYDLYGITIDSLKYYFTVAAIGRSLREYGASVESTVLVADIASCRNEPEKMHQTLLNIGAKRARLLRSISSLYSLGLNIVLMSSYLNGSEFQLRLNDVRSEAARNRYIYELIENTVPESKRDIEARKGYAYAFEEIATIIEYDIKVGPPREKFYDEPARIIGTKLGYLPLLSVYLYPTYPLGVSAGFFLAHEDIETYGVTPYKAGSRGLSNYRIILGHTSIERVRELINMSFVSRNPLVPNPVLDIATIGMMARQLLHGERINIRLREEFYSGSISPNELKELACYLVDNYIISTLEPVFEEEGE